MKTRSDSTNRLHRLRILCVLSIACFQLLGCNRQHKSVDANTPVLKIAVAADGGITLDGQSAAIESVRGSLKQLAQQKGVVWYYREAAQSVPPPQAAEVIKAV